MVLIVIVVAAAVAGYIASRPLAAPGDATVAIADGDADVSTLNRSVSGTRVHLDGSPVRHVYVHFTLSGTDGATQATLTLFAMSAQSVGFDVHATGADWTESDITWANAPSPGALLGSSGPVSAFTAYSFTVPIAGDGPIAFELDSSNPRAIALATREGSTENAPKLTFTPGASGSTSTTTTTSTEPTTTTTPPPPPPTPSGSGPCGLATAPPASFAHVVWIFMENHSRSSVIGNSNAPYETSLARDCGEATDYRENGSPSLPNYIAATSGSTQGIVDDAEPTSHPLPVDNIFRQVRAAGGTAISYAESMPSNCSLTSSGQYLVRHVPAAYYTGADDRQACQTDLVPYSAFDPAKLPTFAFITPNRCDDAHDCPLANGDAWLSANVPAILRSPEYLSGNTLLVITYDETEPMPFIVASAATPPGATSASAYTHYSLLRMTEEVLGLPLLAGARTAGDMRAAFNLGP
jgi:hypothetical protein